MYNSYNNVVTKDGYVIFMTQLVDHEVFDLFVDGFVACDGLCPNGRARRGHALGEGSLVEFGWYN